VFADNEQTDVARSLGKLMRSEQVLFRHAHNANDPTVVGDELHKRNETHTIWDKDRTLYRARSVQGFPQHNSHV
jgi:hypothetical protein